MTKGRVVYTLVVFLVVGMAYCHDKRTRDKKQADEIVELGIQKAERKERLKEIARDLEKLNTRTLDFTVVVKGQELCELNKIAKGYIEVAHEMDRMNPPPTTEEQIIYGINALRTNSPNMGVEKEIAIKLRAMMASGKLVGYCGEQDPLDFFEELEEGYLAGHDIQVARRYFKKLLRSEVVKVKEAARRESLRKEEDWDNMPNRSRLCALADKAVKEWGFTLKEVGIERHLLDDKVY